MHIPLGGFFIQTVNLLAVAQRTQCCNGQNLCLSSGEQTASVDSRQQTHFRIQRTDFINASAVNTLAFIEPVPDILLLQLVQAFIQHCTLFRIFWVILFVNCINNRLHSCIPFVLVVGIQSHLYLFANHCFDGSKQIVVEFHRLEFELRLADFVLDVVDKCNHLLDFCVTSQNRIQHLLFRNFVRTGFNHNDFFHCAGNSQPQVIVCTLFEGRVQDDFAVYQTNADASNRAIPRNIRNGNGNGSCQHASDFRRAIRVNCQNSHDNGNIVPHILREQRTNRTVYHTGSQDCLFRRLSLSLGERARNSANGIHPFFIVHRQREEIHAFSRLCTSSYICHDNGFSVANPTRTIGQFAGFSGFYNERTTCKGGFKLSILFKHLPFSFLL